MGTPRDYYADLELSPTADVQEIKKQFRKLAMKYHPDRNPGHEQEVNAKFQIIQSAHEVLSDPEQKAKYDATRTRSRYPTASGVRGNPWSSAGDQFPPPPRRNAGTRPAPSGAQRWQTRFSQGVPPTAKQATSDPEMKKNTARAFENMRKGNQKPAESARPNPPPPPPRTESAKQRAEASFGTRKAGYHPRSAAPGDEPPVARNNYNTNYNTKPAQESNTYDYSYPGKPGQAPMPDPLKQFREQANARQGSSYAKQTNEKAGPSDKVPLSRTKSAREPSRADSSSPDIVTPSRQRSFSVPKPKDADESVPGTQGQGSPSKFPPEARPKLPLKKTRTGQRGPANATAAEPGTSQHNTSEPSMYDSPPYTPASWTTLSVSNINTYQTRDGSDSRPVQPTMHQDDATCLSDSDSCSTLNPSPSGEYHTPIQLTPFERQQHELLSQLIRNAETSGPAGRKTHSNTNPEQFVSKNRANASFSNSFNIPINDDTFAPNSPGPQTFSRSSTDDINTRFVNEDEPDSWHFSAGGSEQDTPTKSRHPLGNRTERRSPTKRPAVSRSDSSSVPPESENNAEARFNAEGWSKEFGPHNFVPPPPQPKSTSPTRSMRNNSRRGRPAKPPGTTVADGESSSGEDEEFAWRGRKAQQAGPVATDSPQAMDIDSPPANPGTPLAASGDKYESLNVPRNINVEPSRPEWRAGNAEGVNGDVKPQVPKKIPFDPNAAGSEDSEDFMATVADLKKVAPFTQQTSGLKSMNDLKDNLPFESKPSAEIPMRVPKAPTLLFPQAPIAPQLPSVASSGRKPHLGAWEKYVKEFEVYMQQWDEFNGRVVEHFATRKTNIANMRKSKGYSFLESRSDAAIQEYFSWTQQDGEVRRQWLAACDEHETRFKEFMTFRLKMK